ncbi:MAG: hypothetical protein RL368_1428 [Pseudomonadota bacterium]|jgi:hypothetical protein
MKIGYVEEARCLALGISPKDVMNASRDAEALRYQFFESLSDGALRQIEKTARLLPGITAGTHQGDVAFLSAIRRVMKSRSLKPII